MATLASRISDLAGAIRDKFNQIMPRLLPPGGATGQVLSKASNADNSFQWSTVTSGIPSVSADTAPALGGVLNLNGYDLTGKLAVNGTQYVKSIHPVTGSGYSRLMLTARNKGDSANMAAITLFNNNDSSASSTINFDASTFYFRDSAGNIKFTLPSSDGLRGQYLTSFGDAPSAWRWTTPPAAVGFYCGGQPAASEMIGRVHASQTFTIVAANSLVTAATAATASTVIMIRNAGTQIGTATFAAGATTATISITTAAVAKGDLITFHAPDTQDATLANVSGTISN